MFRSKKEYKIVCDTCENEYLLNDVGITLNEAQALNEWSCGICLGTHVGTTKIKKKILSSSKNTQPTKPSKRKHTSQKKTYKGIEILPDDLFRIVTKLGGINVVRTNRKWQDVRKALDLPYSSSSGSVFNKMYIQYFETRSRRSLNVNV